VVHDDLANYTLALPHGEVVNAPVFADDFATAGHQIPGSVSAAASGWAAS